MKRIITVICAILIVASPASAKDNKVPSWVKEAMRDGKRCAKWEPTMKRYGLPVVPFSYIMWRESRCRVKVIGWNYKQGMNHTHCRKADAQEYKRCDAVDSYDSGLFQINSSWVTVTSKVCDKQWGDLTPLLSAQCNFKVTKYLYNNGGLLHWRF